MHVNRSWIISLGFVGGLFFLARNFNGMRSHYLRLDYVLATSTTPPPQPDREDPPTRFNGGNETKNPNEMSGKPAGKVVKTLQPLPRVAVLFKLHALDDNILDRLRHLRYDLLVEPSFHRRAELFEYHLVILYDSLVVNASEVAILQSMANDYHGNTPHSPKTNSARSSQEVPQPLLLLLPLCHPLHLRYCARITLFPFTGRAMHEAYPTQYPRSDFQPPNSPGPKEPLMGRLRHITHDNPEMAYLLWWTAEERNVERMGREDKEEEEEEVEEMEEDKSAKEKETHILGSEEDNLREGGQAIPRPPRSGSSRWAFVWGCEYDVAMAPTKWVSPSAYLDPTAADIVGTNIVGTFEAQKQQVQNSTTPPATTTGELSTGLVGYGGWLDFLEGAMVHDLVMARADILGV
jgi:hypothetical protein